MRILVTGASGFAGRHLLKYLSQTQAETQIHGTIYRSSAEVLPSHSQIHRLDLCDQTAVAQLLEAIRPDAIYHLAGQSSPAESVQHPWDTMRANIKGQLNLLEGCLRLGLRPRVLVVSSSEVYGRVAPENNPIREDHPLQALTPYGLSKITQDLMGQQYHAYHDMAIIRARPFNHIGPGQKDQFVASNFALQIARIEAGAQNPVIHVGNLQAQRDFTDVRDVVRAYAMLIRDGQAGQAYNVASGTSISIQHLLDLLLQLSDVPITVQTETERMRPIDRPLVQGDNRRLRQHIHWTPQYTLEQTLRDILHECRARIQTHGV